MRIILPRTICRRRPAGGIRWRLAAAVILLATSLCAVVAGCGSAAQTAAPAVQVAGPASAPAAGEAGAAQTTALAIQAASPARAVYGTDGREHIEYDLVITNAFTGPATLDSIKISGAGRLLLTLSGKTLAADTLPLFGTTPTVTIPASSAVKTLVGVVLPGSFGRTWPGQLTEQVQYTLPSNAPDRTAIGSTVVYGPTVQISPQKPVLIASPLQGSGWIDANGCCEDPTSSHRQTLIAGNGSYSTPEIFAIDWIREVNGRFFTGDGTKLADYPYYGTPIHAVADGTVVSAVNNFPEVPPNTTTSKNPTLKNPADYSGNSVIEEIAPGVYATYAHMQTGSVTVKAGQRLSAGQVIGKLGDTGNTTLPHLHFGIVDDPAFLPSDSLPFAFGSFTVQGDATFAANNTVTISGKPQHVTAAEPLIGNVINFGQ